jgi:hypothetical protein
MNERFTILAPSEKKASIMMSYIIDHAFDSPMILSRLELDRGEKLDRLRRERSKDHLTFLDGGGVQILTLDVRNARRSIEAAMGFGSKRLILDESSLVDDKPYATVKRMLGGYKYKDAQLFEIGNPFYRNHFYRTWHSTRYHKIFIDYHDGLREGRYSQEFIDEMREEAFFDVFYECLFPAADTIDERGYRVLLTPEEIEERFTDRIELEEDEEDLWLGVDIGGGGDLNVYTLRTPDFAWVESKNRSNDTMTNVTEIQRILKEYPKLKQNRVMVDDTGIGRGVCDRCKELGIAVTPVTLGESPKTPAAKLKYKNIKGEAYWKSGLWVKAGGKILKNEGWMQLSWIKYKIASDKLLMIEPKLEQKKRTGKSPDYADSFMLTFADSAPEPGVRWV